MKNSTAQILDPKILGFWIKCLRETQNMSQDALAAGCGLDVRTIQRVEAGKGASVTTRRCLARGLGYENQDTFDDPEFISTVLQFLEKTKALGEAERAKQFPDYLLVKTTRVESGEALLHFCEAAQAVSLIADEALPRETKEAVATVFDYIRDLIDLGSGDLSFKEKLSVGDDLEAVLREAEGKDTAFYLAFRHVKITNDNWKNKTPMPLQVGYIMAVPSNKEIEEMLVPKRFRLGF